MSTRAALGLGLAVAALGGAGNGALAAQEPETCRPELVRAGGEGRRIQVGPGRIHFYVGGGVLFHCIGKPDSISADSVAQYTELDRVDFVGAVRFRDSIVELTAQRARYFPGDERVEAIGDVRLENRETQSVLRGRTLTYYRAAPGLRDTTELYAPQRPTVEYRPRRDTTGVPYLIVGDRVRLKGEGQAWAAGSVTIDRGEDFAASGDSASLDLEAGHGLLIGQAQASSRDSTGYSILGRRLAFRLEDGELRWVQAQELARATSAEWRIVGDTIEFNVANDLVQGGAVWGDSTRGNAASAQHSLQADSLVFASPDQLLTEVRGFGNGFALSRVDSLSGLNDWMAGDTVVARFDSSETGQRVLVLLEARANASAYYHIFESDDRSGEPAVNYARAVRITARFKDEALERVDFVEQADGVYAEPVGRRPS